MHTCRKLQYPPFRYVQVVVLPLRPTVDIVDAKNVIAAVQHRMNDRRRGGTPRTKRHTILGMFGLCHGSFKHSTSGIPGAGIFKAHAERVGILWRGGDTWFGLDKGRGETNGRHNGVGRISIGIDISRAMIAS